MRPPLALFAVVDVVAGAIGDRLGALPALALGFPLCLSGSPAVLVLVKRFFELAVEAFPIHRSGGLAAKNEKC